MKTRPIVPAELRGVFAVPPLARRHDAKRSIDFDANRTLIGHIRAGGITRFLYGGNAFLYHVTLGEYGDLLDWLESFDEECWMIPSVGPAFGRALDQAAVRGSERGSLSGCAPRESRSDACRQRDRRAACRGSSAPV